MRLLDLGRGIAASPGRSERPIRSRGSTGTRRIRRCAGTDTVWFPGSRTEDLQGFANVADATLKSAIPDAVCNVEIEDGWSMTSPVGTYAANAFGLHDVHGGVREWCRDRFGDYIDCPVRPGDGLREAEPSVRLNNLGLRPSRALHPLPFVTPSAR